MDTDTTSDSGHHSFGGVGTGAEDIAPGAREPESQMDRVRREQIAERGYARPQHAPAGEPPPPAIVAALVRAQREAKSVGKAGKNDWHGYRYATAESMLEEGRDALNKAGLALYQVGWFVMPPHFSGDAVRISIRYVLGHESGATWTIEGEHAVIPEKGRPLDKAEAGALTANFGYVMRGLLALPRVEEGTDVDQRDDRSHDPGRQQRAPQRQARQPERERPAAEKPPAFDVAGLVARIKGVVNDEELAAAREEANAARPQLTKQERARVADAIRQKRAEIDAIGEEPSGSSDEPENVQAGESEAAA